MANVKFNKPGAASARPATRTQVIEGQVVEPESGATTLAVTTVGVPTPPPRPIFADDDNIDYSEVQLPKLKLAQNVGDLGTIFDPGTFVLGDEIPLMTRPASKNPGKDYVPELVRVAVLGFRPTRWTEKVEGGQQGDLLNSEKEVYAVGGTTNYSEKDVKPYYRPLCTALVLVEKPATLQDGHDAAFPYVDSVTKKRYAIATWSMQGSSHTSAAKPLKTWRGALRQFRDGPDDPTTGAYRNKFIDIQVVFKSFPNGNSAFVPTLKRPTELTTPEVRAIAEEFIPSAPTA